METSFAVEPIWSWLTVGLVAVGLVGLVLVTYPQRVRHLNPGARRTLLSLRIIAALLLVAAMLRPVVQYTERDRQSAQMVVIADASRSMSTKDMDGGVTRREALVKLEAEQHSRFDKLKPQIEILRYDFDRDLRSVSAFDAKSPGEMSAIGSALDTLLKESAGKRLLGVFLLSDGAQRAISPHDVDPRTVARQYGQQQIPISPIPFGKSVLSDATLDLAVEDLVVSSVVFEKNTVPVQAKVRLSGAAGKAVSVRLLVEDRSGRSGLGSTMVVPKVINDARPSATIQTSANNSVESVELSFVPEIPGEYKIGVEVTPLDGELKTNNNRRETFISVQRGGVKVAYIDIARVESKFLRTVNQGKQIQLDFHWVRSGGFGAQTKLDPALFTPGRYDVFIIGDVPASVFGAAALDQLARRLDDGAALMMLGGFQSFGLGGYSETPLADFLPVLMSAREVAPQGELATDLHVDQSLQMLPTEAGLNHFIMRLRGENNATLWQQLPALRGANKLKPKDVALVLAQTPERIPLLFSAEVGRSRVLAFAGDTTHRWASAEKNFTEEHQRFWRQVILWLSRKEDDTEQPVWVKVLPRNFAQGLPVPIEFGAQDGKGKPIKDAEFKVVVLGPDGKDQQVAGQRQDRGLLARYEQTQLPGTYRVSVSASSKGQPLGDAVTRFLVDARDLELDNPAADADLLRELAALTGGRVMTPENWTEYLDELVKNGAPNLDEVRITRVELWDNWGFLSAFVAAMTIEWFLRKRRGLV